MSFNKFLINLIEKFHNFCSKTSFHGFPYIVNGKLSCGGRILWGFILGAQLYACYFYATLIFERKNAHPVLLAFDSKSTLVSDVSIFYLN